MTTTGRTTQQQDTAMNQDPQQQHRFVEPKMGIEEVTISEERLTRSECKKRGARFAIIGIYLNDASSGCEFRLKAQTVLDSALLPEEWAGKLESYGEAIWRANRAIFRHFEREGCAELVRELLDGECRDEGEFARRIEGAGSRSLNLIQQSELIDLLVEHRAAFSKAWEWSAIFNYVPVSKHLPVFSEARSKSAVEAARPLAVA